MKKFIVITGGAGFIGSNLIEFLVNKTKYNLISIDNYSSGSKKNHIMSQRIKYLKGDTKNKGEPCDFVRALYILGVFKDKRYIPWLSYLSNNIAAPTYIYCGLGFLGLIYEFWFKFSWFN